MGGGKLKADIGANPGELGIRSGVGNLYRFIDDRKGAVLPRARDYGPAR